MTARSQLIGAMVWGANAFGVKGVGEIGVCGSGAAVANAVFNATGVRVREFPVTLEKVLTGLPG